MDFADRNDQLSDRIAHSRTEKFLHILNIPVARFCKFFTWIETVPSFIKRFLKDDLKSLYLIRRTLLCKRLILLLIERL